MVTFLFDWKVPKVVICNEIQSSAFHVTIDRACLLFSLPTGSLPRPNSIFVMFVFLSFSYFIFYLFLIQMYSVSSFFILPFSFAGWSQEGTFSCSDDWGEESFFCVCLLICHPPYWKSQIEHDCMFISISNWIQIFLTYCSF